MNAGKTLFTQLMDFLPWSTFARIVSRYGGDRAVRVLPCNEQFRAMAFAQPTYRESLRDIEACLSAQARKLYHIEPPRVCRRLQLPNRMEP
jgi:GGDEF domain-containing protein